MFLIVFTRGEPPNLSDSPGGWSALPRRAEAPRHKVPAALLNLGVNFEAAAVLAELGRQPYWARDFLVKYQDRVLMGKDIYEVNEYKWYFRALETRDEYFEYYRPRHAFWRIYGFQVPDEVLKKVYYKNALKLVPGLDAKPFPE